MPQPQSATFCASCAKSQTGAILRAPTGARRNIALTDAAIEAIGKTPPQKPTESFTSTCSSVAQGPSHKCARPKATACALRHASRNNTTHIPAQFRPRRGICAQRQAVATRQHMRSMLAGQMYHADVAAMVWRIRRRVVKHPGKGRRVMQHKHIMRPMPPCCRSSPAGQEPSAKEAGPQAHLQSSPQQHAPMYEERFSRHACWPTAPRSAPRRHASVSLRTHA